MNSKKQVWVTIGILIIIGVMLISIYVKLADLQNRLASQGPNIVHLQLNLCTHSIQIEKVEGNGNAFGDMATIYNNKSV